MSKSLSVAGKYIDENGVEYSKTLKTDNQGAPFFNVNNDDTVIIGTMTVGAGKVGWSDAWAGKFPIAGNFLNLSTFNSFSVTISSANNHEFELGYFSWRDSSGATFPPDINSQSSRGKSYLQLPFYDVKMFGLRMAIANRSAVSQDYVINLILKKTTTEPRNNFGNTVVKYVNNNFAYTNSGRRFFGKNASATYATAEILDMSFYGNRTIMIYNRHTDISINIEIILTTEANGLLPEYELGTIITDTIAPGENKLYYPHSFPELNIPAPGMSISLQRSAAPVATGLGVDVTLMGGAV